MGCVCVWRGVRLGKTAACDDSWEVRDEQEVQKKPMRVTLCVCVCPVNTPDETEVSHHTSAAVNKRSHRSPVTCLCQWLGPVDFCPHASDWPSIFRWHILTFDHGCFRGNESGAEPLAQSSAQWLGSEGRFGASWNVEIKISIIATLRWLVQDLHTSKQFWGQRSGYESTQC